MYKIIFLERAKRFIEKLEVGDRAKIAAAAQILSEGDFRGVRVKTLKQPVKELIVRSHRLTFFTENNVVYFVSGFRRKSRKAPKSEMEYAEKIMKIIINK